MKFPAADYTELKNDFRSVVQDYFEKKAERKIDVGLLSACEYWQIFHKVCAFRDYGDENVNAAGRCIEKSGKGIPYLYSLGLNDSHIGTALKKICKELAAEKVSI